MQAGWTSLAQVNHAVDIGPLAAQTNAHLLVAPDQRMRLYLYIRNAGPHPQWIGLSTVKCRSFDKPKPEILHRGYGTTCALVTDT